MLEIRIPISEVTAAELEELFCEDYQQSWMIHVEPGEVGEQLRGYFESTAAAVAAYAALRSRVPQLPLDWNGRELLDQDWREAYKLHFRPWSDRGLHWVPVWERASYQVPEGDSVVYLDPGMAFGTGNHETTRLCVRRLLDARDRWRAALPQLSVVDAGCGSGILAISAAKLGFGDVFGFDNDPDAVTISADNARLCEVENAVEWRWADLAEGLAGRQSDLLLVNILANVLCDHRELLCSAVKPGGWLVLSGILAREVDAVHAAFAAVLAGPSGAPPAQDSRCDGDWADLCYRMPTIFGK